MKLEIEILENEYFWGGSTQYAKKLPISRETEGYFLDMNDGHNQTMPLYLSTLGRCIFCEEPMVVTAESGVITLEAEGEIVLEKFGGTLLGDKVLVAPVITKGQTRRTVALPEGRWLYLEKEPYEGGKTVTVPAPIDTLPYFVKR